MKDEILIAIILGIMAAGGASESDVISNDDYSTEYVQEYEETYTEELEYEEECYEDEPQKEIYEADTAADDGYSYYGCMTLTAYEWTGSPCADGVYPEVGYTAACNDPALWHRWVYIEGLGTYYIHDTGGMGYGVIDIYLGDYDSCIQFGSWSANVYLID